ncbi:MAG: UDP-3-O-acyl-N-acetylglucosamine deacetylase, partial [Selenomonadales bacterium]|nr:UDP-3-O-acyl-N-acetylglucosamine deacetylase [Selenomonadales bacterium]
MQHQKTLARSISYTGIGLHSGKDVTIMLHPAEEHTGIVFKRVDLPSQPSVRAVAGNVTNTMRATTLEEGEAKVFTVEHLMAAFHVMGVTNCLVEIT